MHSVLSNIFSDRKEYFFMKLTKRKDGRYCTSRTINGERVFFYSSERTEKKAEKDIENQMLAYQGKIEKGRTLQSVADEWEEEHYNKIQYQTASRYKSYVARITKYFADTYIKDIKSDEIERFYQGMVLQGFSSKTIKDQASVVKLIMRYALIKRYIDTNVADFVTPPKGKPKEERQPLTKKEIKAVEESIGTEFGNIAYFLLYTGLRKGEMLALTYGDIDFKNNFITVNKSVEYIGNKPNVKSPKTKAGTRHVPLPEALKFLFSGKHKKDDLIFSQNGNIMSKSYFREHWIKYCKEIGIDVTPHQFRHTYATLLFEWKITEKDAQQILGHADISTTQNIYTHISDTRMKQTTRDINKKIRCCQRVVNE